MRGVVENTKKLSLTHNNNNKSSKEKFLKNSRVNNKSNNNNNMASSDASKSTTAVSNTTSVATTTTTTTVTGLRKFKTRPKSTDCKMLQQQNNGAQHKQQFKQQQQRPKSSIIAGTTINLNNNNINTNQTKNTQKQITTKINLPKASQANTNEEITGGVQDTIYLCNFRVSVDGEWLCLKELQDLDCNHSQSSLQQAPSSNNNVTSQAQYAAWQKNKRYSGICSQGDENGILILAKNSNILIFVVVSLCCSFLKSSIKTLPFTLLTQNIPCLTKKITIQLVLFAEKLYLM